MAVSSCKTDFWQVIFCSDTIYDFGQIKITRAEILAKWFLVFLHIKLFQSDISSLHESWWFGQEKWRHAELYDSTSWAYRNKRAEWEEHLKFLGSSAGADNPHISLLWKQTSKPRDRLEKHSPRQRYKMFTLSSIFLQTTDFRNYYSANALQIGHRARRTDADLEMHPCTKSKPCWAHSCFRLDQATRGKDLPPWGKVWVKQR